MAVKLRPDETVSPLFLRIVTVIVCITLVAGAFWLVTGIAIAHPTATQSSTTDGAQATFKAGLTFLLGMVGGKVTP
jgi:hypothetical protein